MNKWNEKKAHIIYKFDKYPEFNEKCWIETKKGIFESRYEKWDWSDSNCSYDFRCYDFCKEDILAWHPFTLNQPERSKREDCKLNLNEKICIGYYDQFNSQQECEDRDRHVGNCCPTVKQVLDFIQMRCSEHCGNTVRDK